MKLGTNFAPFIKRNSLEDTIKKIAKAGFSAIDFSLSRDYGVKKEDEESYYKGIKKLCDDLNLTITQGHSPIGRPNPSIEYFLSDEYISGQISAIRKAGYLNIPCVVIHPFTREPVEGTSNAYTEELRQEGYKVNFEFYSRLAPELIKANVTCAIENLAQYDFDTQAHCHCFGSSSADLNKIIDDLNKKFSSDNLFGACFDVGHANLVEGESLTAFIKSLGKRLKCVHVHDNWGVLTSWGGGLDRHLLPFEGEIPFKDVKKALEEINFQGAFSFECINYMPNDEFDNIMIDYLYKAGKLILEN